jgi:3-hydroxyacyl-CoA dehydrogenase
LEDLIEVFSEKVRKTRREFSKEEILQRCLYFMITEGAKILEGGMSFRPGDVNGVWVNGYGWPVYRSDPMYCADTPSAWTR